MRRKTRVFVSYAKEQFREAELISLALQEAGYEVFYDRGALQAGHAFDGAIEAAINRSDLFIFLISPTSVADGRYTLTELGIAKEKWRLPKGHVLPVMVVETPLLIVPPYLQRVTILQPKGNLTAEVVSGARRLVGTKRRRSIGFALTASAAVGLIALFVSGNMPKLGDATVEQADPNWLRYLRREKEPTSPPRTVEQFASTDPLRAERAAREALSSPSKPVSQEERLKLRELLKATEGQKKVFADWSDVESSPLRTLKFPVASLGWDGPLGLVELPTTPGIDLNVGEDAVVRAALPGIVERADTSESSGRSDLVVRNSISLVTTYSFLGDLAVKNGQIIDVGQSLGTVVAKGSRKLWFEFGAILDGKDVPENHLRAIIARNGDAKSQN